MSQRATRPTLDLGRRRLLRPRKRRLTGHLHHHPDRCVNCGACAGHCRLKALTVDQASYRVTLLPELCCDCSRCLPACVYRALELVPGERKEARDGD